MEPQEERERRLAQAQFERCIVWCLDAFYTTFKGLCYAYVLWVGIRFGVLWPLALAWFLGWLPRA